MHDLNRALTDIRAMRAQLARGTEFRGYGPATVALTGLLAAGAAVAQAYLIPAPGRTPLAWVGLWSGVACLAIAVIGAEMLFRARRVHSGLADEMVQEAALQLLPAAGAGVLLTVVLFHAAPAAIWMLPGLWQVLLSLGVFSACRSLPGAMNLAGFWYLGAGLACLAFGDGGNALSPWAMGAPFGLGDGLAAVLLAWAGRGDE
jgi:hypothetical protein